MAVRSSKQMPVGPLPSWRFPIPDQLAIVTVVPALSLLQCGVA